MFYFIDPRGIPHRPGQSEPRVTTLLSYINLASHFTQKSN